MGVKKFVWGVLRGWWHVGGGWHSVGWVGYYVYNSCQVSLKSVWRLQKSGKCFSQKSEIRTAICLDGSAQKHIIDSRHWALTSSQVSSQSVSTSVAEEKLKCLRLSEAKTAIFVDGTVRNTQLGRWRWVLASGQVSSKFVQRSSRRSRKWKG